MATQHPEHYVVILSWNRTESRTLQDLPDLVKRHAAIGGEYRFVIWDWTASRPEREQVAWRQRFSAPIEFRSRMLQLFLRQAPYRNNDEHSDPEITLIAQGRSCRVIKNYLCGLVEETHEDWRDRQRIRQAIFIAPRNPRRFRVMLWSAVGLAVMSAASYLWAKLHEDAGWVFDLVAFVGTLGSAMLFALLTLFMNEEALRHLGLTRVFDSADLDRKFEEKIVNGSKRQAGTWPIPSQTLPVAKLSATTDAADRIASAIGVPRGHKNVYEVDVNTVRIDAAPSDSTTLPPRVRERGAYGNCSRRTLTVLFSEGNNTDETALQPYDLKYRTNGFMIVDREPTPNLWSDGERGDWDANGQNYHYKFRPAAGSAYTLGLCVYGGFNEGDRSAHSHIEVFSYIRRLEYMLDLSPYLDAGWSISRPPEVYYFPPQPPHVVGKDRIFPGERCDCLAAGRKLDHGRRLNVLSTQKGVYQWTIYSVRNGGMIGFLFDVAAPKTNGVKAGGAHVG
jgi:hypothetical protein